MDNFTPFSATAGGILIGISVTLLLLFNGRIGGISGIMSGVFFTTSGGSAFLPDLSLVPSFFNGCCLTLQLIARITLCHYLAWAVS
jgi:hypothetical protein